MKTTALKASALLLLLLALPGVAKAQPVDRSRPVTDTVTGIDASPAGMAVPVPAMNPDVLKDYMRALEAVDMAVEFEARGATRGLIGVDKVKIDARWERRPGETSPVLRGMTIKPEGGRLVLGGMGVNKITIDDKGVMKLDIHRFPNLTVKKITRNAAGDIKLHIDWFPDITIKADGNVKLLGMIGLGNVGASPMGAVVSNWPPRMEDVVNALSQPMAAGTTKHEGSVRWDVRGRAAPFPLRLADGSSLPAATSFSVRGAGVLEPDGTFRTIGAGNAVTVNVNVGGRRVAMSGVSGTIESGTATFTGRYGVSIPRGLKENLILDVNGDVSYAVDGNDVTLNLPTGTRVRTSNVDVSGSAHLTARVAPSSRGGNNVVLSDGTYKLDASGPISVSGLRVRGVTSEEIGLDGRVHAEGSFSPSGNGLTVTGAGSGELTTTGPGLVDVLMGNDRARATVREGSRVSFGVDEFTATTAAEPSTGAASLVDASARGRIDAAIELGGVSATVGGNSVTADAVHADAAFTIEGTERGLTAASGTTTLRLDSDGALRARMPAAELPGELGAVTHRVAAGDTLYKIARTNGVSVPALRAANGLTNDTIAVGSTLRIPGSASSQPAASAPDGSLVTTLDRGSEVTVGVRSARMTPRGLEIDGHLTAKVSVSNLDLVSGKLEAKILGAARASLDTDFTVRPGANGRPVVRTGSFRVPVRVEINRGSRVVVNLPGRETDIVMDRDGSYAEFTAVVKLDDAGNMQVDELAAVDVLLTSNGTARFGGDMVDVPGEKTIRYTGRIVMRERGLDFYGDITLNVRGPADRPIVRIRW